MTNKPEVEYATLERSHVLSQSAEKYPSRACVGGLVEVVRVRHVGYLFTSTNPISPTLLYGTGNEVDVLRDLAKDGWRYVCKTDNATLLSREVQTDKKEPEAT